MGEWIFALVAGGLTLTLWVSCSESDEEEAARLALEAQRDAERQARDDAARTAIIDILATDPCSADLVLTRDAVGGGWSVRYAQGSGPGVSLRRFGDAGLKMQQRVATVAQFARVDRIPMELLPEC